MTLDTTTGPSVASPQEPFRGGLAQRLVDLCNPVLVKEVRQAQRGKVFVIALIVSVLLALLATALTSVELQNYGDKPGRQFFTVVYGFLALAMIVVVPFQAYISMGAEWDDHTFEMLVLSNLKPRQIVLGKILAALVQGLLFLATFLPFIATAFLLRGVDALVLATILGLTLMASLWFSTVSTMLSTLTRNRFLRVLLMVAMAGALVAMVSGAIPVASGLLRRPDMVAETEFWLWMGQLALAWLLSGAFAFCVSCNLLAHEEENRSTNLRVLLTLTLLAYFAIMAVNISVPRLGMPREAVFGTAIFAMFQLSLAGIFFVSEADPLGRRVKPSVPRSGGAALLTLPWFPGGGRGFVYLALHVSLLIVGAFVLASFADVGRSLSSMSGMPVDVGLMSSGGTALLLSTLYVALYALVPVGVIGWLASRTPGGRALVRTVAIFSPILYLILPAIFGLLVDDYDMQSMRHFGNPGQVIGEAFDNRGDVLPGQLALLAFPLAAIGVLMALPRAVRALRETLAVSAEKRKAHSGAGDEPVAEA